VSRSDAIKAETESKLLTGPRDDVINGLSSQIMLQSDDSLQIGTSDCGEKIQRIKASEMVVAPL
jgi:hypothetical protein